jgi:hypothetical protein
VSVLGTSPKKTATVQSQPTIATASPASQAPLPASTPAAIPVSAPVTAKPAAVQGAGKPVYGVTLGSIKGLKSNAREKIEAAGKGKETVEISSENLQTAWQQIVLEMTSDKVFFRNAINQGSIGFEGLLIQINVFGVAFDFLKNLRLKLLDYFKHYYQNDEINVIIIEKAPEPEKMVAQVMSTKEVFEKMAEKNPLLRILKDNLALDFDY